MGRKRLLNRKSVFINNEVTHEIIINFTNTAGLESIGKYLNKSSCKWDSKITELHRSNVKPNS
jgi:hypothetical protein